MNPVDLKRIKLGKSRRTSSTISG